MRVPPPLSGRRRLRWRNTHRDRRLDDRPRYSHGHKHTNVNLVVSCAGFNRLVNAWRRSVGDRASGIIVARRRGHIHCRQCPDCAVRRHGIVCAFDADNPHSLAAAMLAGILLRFGLQAFGTLNGEFVMCGGMLLAWLLFKVFAPRYAVIAAMVMGITVALIQVRWR